MWTDVPKILGETISQRIFQTLNTKKMDTHKTFKTDLKIMKFVNKVLLIPSFP